MPFTFAVKCLGYREVRGAVEGLGALCGIFIFGESTMQQDTSKKVTIDHLELSHSITMNQTQASLEVLRAYFENRISGNAMIDIPESTIVSFLYQIDENLERMDNIVVDIVKEAKPVKLRLAVG